MPANPSGWGQGKGIPFESFLGVLTLSSGMLSGPQMAGPCWGKARKLQGKERVVVRLV